MLRRRSTPPPVSGSARPWLCACAAVAVAGLLAANPARAQDVRSCAVQPDGAAANVRALPSTCGNASFPVDAIQRRQGALQVVIGDSSLYVRTVRLTYANSAAGAITQTAEVSLHRLMQPGDTTDPIPIARNGLVLIGVTLDVNPPGYGSAPPMLALAAVQADGAIAPPTGEPATTAALDPAEWILIGSGFAHLDQLRDVIAIGREKGRFDRLVISTRGNDLPVQSVQVVPVDFPAYAIDLRTVMPPGTLSPIIPIDPPDFVREVIVTYGTAAPASRVPTVEVRGRFAWNWLGRTGQNRQSTGGWVMLGTVDVIASPHSGLPRGSFRIDAVNRGQDSARFKRMRFVARRGAVSLSGFSIDTGGGQNEDVAAETLLLPDVPSTPMAFPSGPLSIASVSINPRIGPHARMDSTVEIWAQY